MTDLSRRTLGRLLTAGAFSGLAGAPGWALAAPPAAAEVEAALRWVNPQYKAFFPLLRQSIASPTLDAAVLATQRKAAESAKPTPPAASPPVVERTIPGPRGAPDVRVFVVNAGGSGKPAILHTHGGGYVLGTAREYLSLIQPIAKATDSVIVSVDYRLAPETKFPGSLEDNYAALKWLHANAAELGADPTRIAVMGESAGGGHAAMLAIAARDRGEVPLVYQVLTYPMLDDRTGSTRPAPAHVGEFVWRPADNRFGWTSLLGVPAGSARVPPGSVPAREPNLKGLPPAFIAVGSIDLFCEEDIAYAGRLIEAGVPAELHVYPGAFHAFNIAPVEQARQYNEALVAALKGAFAQRG